MEKMDEIEKISKLKKMDEIEKPPQKTQKRNNTNKQIMEKRNLTYSSRVLSNSRLPCSFFRCLTTAKLTFFGLFFGLLQIRSSFIDMTVSRDPLVLTEEIDEHSLGGLGLGSTLAISIEAFLSRKSFSLILISMVWNVLGKMPALYWSHMWVIHKLEKLPLQR